MCTARVSAILSVVADRRLCVCLCARAATWMLQVSNAGAEQAIGVDFADIYRRSDLHRSMEGLIERLSVPPPGSAPLHFQHKHAQSSFFQFQMIFWKCACTPCCHIWLTSGKLCMISS